MKNRKKFKGLNNKGYEMSMMIAFLVGFAVFLLITVILAYKAGL